MHVTYDVCSEFNKWWKGTVSMAISTTTKLFFAACVSTVAVVSIVKFAGAQDVAAKPSGTDFLLADECSELLREIEASNGDAESGRRIAARFMSLPYARLPVSKMDRPVDFSCRKRCLEKIVSFRGLKEDETIHLSLIACLEGLRPLPMSHRLDDMKSARELLLHLCYSDEDISASNNFKPDGKTMRGALLVHPSFTGLYDDIRREYDARERYNGEQEAYRTASIAAIRKAVMDGYKDKTSEERVAIWDEFCRRAKATPDERKKAEE